MTNTAQHCDAGATGRPAGDTAANTPAEHNEVRQTVESICRIQADMHEIRENLVAYGVPFQTVNVLVEMGARDKLSEQEDLIEAALAGSASELGVGALSRDTLMQQLGLLINLENDTAEVRRLAKSQGLELPALNALTLFVRQNPGDGGARMIRCFVAYALACGVSLDGIGSLHAELTSPKASVLPVIERRPVASGRVSGMLLVREALVGLLIGVGVMLLVV